MSKKQIQKVNKVTPKKEQEKDWWEDIEFMDSSHFDLDWKEDIVTIDLTKFGVDTEWTTFGFEDKPKQDTKKDSKKLP